MGATLSLCWFTQEWMFFGHIGDSRIYHLPSGGALRQLSEDDTYVGWLFRNGKINEREARSHPRRNVIQRALGNGHQYVAPQVGAIRVEANDQVLICSDGIIDGLFDDQIAEILRGSQNSTSPFTPAEQLVRAAVQASGRDNTTALVIGVS
jgi:protein phosphatase